MPCTCGLNAAQMTSKELLGLRPIEYCDEIEVRDSFYTADGYFEESRPVGMVDARCESCQSACNSAESGYWDFDNQIIAEAVALNLDTWGGVA